MTAWRGIQKRPSILAEAVAKLTSDFRSKSVVVGMLTSYVRQVGLTDDAAVDVVYSRALDDAENAQLDAIGSFVQEARLGRDDDTYREAIRVRVRLNRSQSTEADLFALVALIWSSTWTLLEIPYGYFEVRMSNVPQTLAPTLKRVLSRLRPLGHQGSLSQTPLGASQTMRFAGEGASGTMPLQTGQAGTVRMAHEERL